MPTHDTETQTMTFDLFSPFLREGRVDARLPDALGIPAIDGYTGELDKVLEASEGASIAFYIESRSGRRVFFDVKLSETGFGACEADASYAERLDRDYRPYLQGEVDAKWLEPAACAANDHLMRSFSYLGRYPDSGLAFIFPRANARLMEADKTIKQIASKSLAPRVAILYLEYLVERILKAVADDERLHAHFLQFRERYILSSTVLKSPSVL